MDAYMWALLTACIWGIVPILEKIGLDKVDPYVGVFYRCIGVIIGITVLGIFVVKPHQLKAVPPRSIIILIVAGILASFLAQITFYHSLKTGEVSRVVPIAGMYYLITFVLGILIFKEPLTLTKVAGIFMVASGVFLLRF
jgi:bacterial/archaeal transporter family protein